jgi:hypothetical protein
MNALSRRAPTILRSLAVAGVLVAIVGTIVIWVFLGDLEDTTERSLLIGEQATLTLEDTIDVAEQVLDAVDDGLSTVQATLLTLDELLQSTAGLAESTGSLSATLPASFEDIDAALATVERLGETVDSTLSALSSLPFGPDYEPSVPFPEAVADLRLALEPISADLTRISGELQNFANGSSDLTADIDSLTADVQRTRAALSGTDALLRQYRASTSEAGQLAAETRDQLSGSMTWRSVSSCPGRSRRSSRSGVSSREMSWSSLRGRSRPRARTAIRPRCVIHLAFERVTERAQHPHHTPTTPPTRLPKSPADPRMSGRGQNSAITPSGEIDAPDQRVALGHACGHPGDLPADSVWHRHVHR